MAWTIWFWQLTFPVMIILCSLVTDYKWTVLNLKCGSPSRWTAVKRQQRSSARDWRVAASAGRSLKLQHRLQHCNILFHLTHALCAPHQTWATRILNHIRVPRQKIVDSNIYSLICAGTLLWQIGAGLFWLAGCIHANIIGSIREWLRRAVPIITTRGWGLCKLELHCHQAEGWMALTVHHTQEGTELLLQSSLLEII